MFLWRVYLFSDDNSFNDEQFSNEKKKIYKLFNKEIYFFSRILSKVNIISDNNSNNDDIENNKMDKRGKKNLKIL